MISVAVKLVSKPFGSTGSSSGPALLQSGQGSPAPPQPHAVGPSQGRSGWFSQTQQVPSQRAHVTCHPQCFVGSSSISWPCRWCMTSPKSRMSNILPQMGHRMKWSRSASGCQPIGFPVSAMRLNLKRKAELHADWRANQEQVVGSTSTAATDLCLPLDLLIFLISRCGVFERPGWRG
jgi:hypothetical protein